jgi:hypothetical protein
LSISCPQSGIGFLPDLFVPVSPETRIRQQDADATFNGDAVDIRTGFGLTRLRSRVPGAEDIARKLLDT